MALPVNFLSVFQSLLNIEEHSYPIFRDRWMLLLHGMGIKKQQNQTNAIELTCHDLVETIYNYQHAINVCNNNFGMEYLRSRNQLHTSLSKLMSLLGKKEPLSEEEQCDILDLLDWFILKTSCWVSTDVAKVLIFHSGQELYDCVKERAAGGTRVCLVLVYLYMMLSINVPRAQLVLFFMKKAHLQFTQTTKLKANSAKDENHQTDANVKHKIDFPNYLKDILSEWDSIQLPILHCFLKTSTTTQSLGKIISNTQKQELRSCKYTKELQIWLHFTEKFDLSKKRDPESWKFVSPIEWIVSSYQTVEPLCTQYIEMMRNSSPLFSTPLTKIKLPIFDEVLFQFIELAKMESFEVHNNPSTPTEHLMTWYMKNQWYKNKAIRNIFLIVEGQPHKFPKIVKGYVGFWSLVYCVATLSDFVTEKRSVKTTFYKNLFDCKKAKKDILPSLKAFVNSIDQQSGTELTQALNNLTDDRLDYYVQSYFTCFLDLLDWVVDSMRIGKRFDDDNLPLLMLYPHPRKDLAFSNHFNLSYLLQYLRFWHDGGSSNISSLITLLEKAFDFRSHGRSMRKKLGDCCEKNFSMTFIVKVFSMLMMMGLYRNPVLSTSKEGIHTSLPHIFRPTFDTVYYLYRYFFDRRQNDVIYRHNIHKVIATFLKGQNIPTPPPKNDDEVEGKVVHITFSEEFQVRKATFREKGHALIPISNDLLLNYLERSPKLSNLMVKEFFISFFVNSPQYYCKFRNPNDQSTGSAIETKWEDYFIKTTFLNNVYRFNLGIMVTTTIRRMEQEKIFPCEPWSFDTIMSNNLRKISINNKVTKQFDRFYGTKVYPFAKQSFPVVAYSQLDYFMEALIRNTIKTEQDIADLKALINSVIPSLSVRLAPMKRGQTHQKHLKFLLLCMEKLLGHLGCAKTTTNFVKMKFDEFLNNKISVEGFTAILEKTKRACLLILSKKIEMHNYYTTPLDNDTSEKIWSLFFNTTEELSMVQVLERLDTLFSKTENLLLFQVIKLHKEIQSPKEIRRLVGFLPVASFKKFHYFFETMYNSQNISLIPLDLSSAQQIHQTITKNKFGLIPGIHINPSYEKEMYKVYITFCCNGVVSCSTTSMLYGHSQISFDHFNQKYVCTKKKVKKTKDKTNKAYNHHQPKHPKKVTAKSQGEAKGQTMEETVSMSTFDELASQRLETIISQRGVGNTHDLFSKVLAEMKFQAISIFPSEEVNNVSLGSELEQNQKMDAVIKSIDENRFKNILLKVQNKWARILKRMRQPNCSQNPPVPVIDVKGKRLFHGKDEKGKQAYQHCLKCGNFTYYQDDNWGPHYECGLCWINSLAILCRCVYCRSIQFLTLDKVKQKLKKKTDINILLAEDLSKQSSAPQQTQEAKESEKKLKETIKSNNKQKILHECLHVQMFPVCYVELNKERRNATVKERFQLNQRYIDDAELKRKTHQRHFSGSQMFLSSAYYDVFCFFNLFFCQQHQPPNPNSAKKQSKSTQSLILSGGNFNMNNKNRISFLDVYWDIRSKQKTKVLQKKTRGDTHC